MVMYPLFPAVTSSRRRKILAPLPAIALLGCMMLLPGPAGAVPPGWDGSDEEELDLGYGEEAEIVGLTARSQHGTVSIFNGMSATRQAWSDQSFYLTSSLADVSPARPANLRVREVWRCAPGYEWSDGTSVATAVAAHTVADPTNRCPHGALYWDAIIAVAYDPRNEQLSTGELWIWVYGNHWPDDWMPIFGPWPPVSPPPV